MAKMTRRGFLGALAAAGATVAAAPAISAVERINGRFRLIGRTLVLEKPLILRGLHDFEIRDCEIHTSNDFVGKSAIIIENCEGGIIEGCTVHVQKALHYGVYFESERDLSVIGTKAEKP